MSEMQTAGSQNKGRYYITKTCYVTKNNRDLVNNDKSMKVTGKKWKLLNYLMEHQDDLVPYEDISAELWPNEKRTHNDITQIIYRLKHDCFGAVGLDDEELKEVLQSISGAGVIFRPYRSTETPLGSIAEGLCFSGIPEKDYADIVHCLMYFGLSGRMGRERLVVLANGGNKLAAVELGELYFYGYITRNHQRDYKTACKWYEKAGDHPVALWTLGYCIMNNFYPVVDPDHIDYSAARDYFQRALEVTTDAGISAAALTSMGQLWETGYYPAKDFATTRNCEKPNIERAIAYYQTADKMGYHYATNRLGLYYEKMANTSQDSREKYRKLAFSCLSRSVSFVTDGYALNKLGLYYERGFGCSVNPAKACECFIRGVEDTLEDDTTGWNYYNAGRVCANRIRQQPQSYYDLPRAFDYFDKALRKLPVNDHGQILLEVLDILTLTGDSAHLQTALIIQTKAWIERYLREFHSESDNLKSAKVMMIQKKAQYLEKMLPQ